MSGKKSFLNIRKSLGITRVHVSKLLGITSQALYLKEKGTSKFTPLEAQKLCDIYNVSLDEVAI